MTDHGITNAGHLMALAKLNLCSIRLEHKQNTSILAYPQFM